MLGNGASGPHGRAAPEVLVARTPDEVPGLLQHVEGRVDCGSAAAGWVAYEAACAFDRAMTTQSPRRGLDALAVFLVSDDWRLVAESELDLRGGRLDLDWQPQIERSRYLDDVSAIRELIRSGDVYQVNYTFPIVASSRMETAGQFSESWRLFANLYRAQRGAYAGYLDDGERVVCSASPELFFAREGDRVVSRPMKGTARRGLDWDEDQAGLRALRASAKERAENVMIVDMVRNDLGRIASAGTVVVDSIFELETYPTVHQMVSTVSASSSARLVDVFRALFPPASITGAPKISSMRAIAELEVAPRGVYTGTVGWLLPDGRCQFNVAIRSATLTGTAGGAAEWCYGTGSGVVWDSDAESEWRECEAKALNLRHRLPRFRLLETLLLRRTGYVWLEQHLERLRQSAIYFGFAPESGLDRRSLVENARQLLQAEDEARPVTSERAVARGEPGADTFKVRLLVNRRGEVEVEAAPVALRPRATWRLAIASDPVSSNDRFLRHKTTYRGVYRRALERARLADPNVDDVLLFNERGELTESTFANLVLDLEQDGRSTLVTPARSSGLLDGVLRERLLVRGRIEERVLRMEDLARARRLWLINSVRGIVPAEVSLFGRR